MSHKGLKLRGLESSGAVTRERIKTFIINKYFNLFMNSVKWNNLGYQEANFLMRKLWADGSVAVFVNKGTKGSSEYPEGQLVFTPYASNEFNIYDYPTKVSLIRLRPVSFIPLTPQKVDEDVVIIYAQHNKKSLYSVVEYYADKIANVETTITTNLKSQKTPWLIGITAENDEKMRAFNNNLNLDDPQILISLEEAQNAKALVSGAPYIIDKLYAYEDALENELREYFGFRNLGGQEKKEHLITSEVNANSELTESSGDCIFDVLQSGTDNVLKVLGVDMGLEFNKAEQYEENMEEEEMEEQENEQ